MSGGRPEKHSLTLQGHRTSVSLEPAFWRAVREIAAAVGPVFEEMEKQASTTAGLREKIWPVIPDGAP